MQLYAHAVLYTVFVWWFTTGAIIYLDGLPRRFCAAIMWSATVVLVLALHGLAATSNDASAAGAYMAFTCALLAWGWNEMGFLMGVVTGPRDTACPEGAAGGQRLVYAIQAVLYHEAAIAVTAFVIMAVTAAGANQVGVWTFMLLWAMRLSAKINVFLGVPNITEEFLPEHLKYLKTYFRTLPMNAAFPLSITGTTLLTGYLVMGAAAPGAGPFEATAFTLLAALAGLALLEHWFMVLPIPATALWEWGLVSHATHSNPVPVRVAAPVVLPPVPGFTAAFYEATGTAPSDPALPLPAEVPPVAAGPPHEATIVPFPSQTPVTHRRRP